MKKWLLALLSLMLVAAMTLSLAACGDAKKDDKDEEEESVSDTEKKDDEEETTSDEKGDEDTSNESANTDSIVGEWKGKIPFVELIKIGAPDMDAMMLTIYEEALDGCTITAVLEVGDDGNATMYYEDIDKAGDTYLEAFSAYMKDGGIYTIYEAQGYSSDELDAVVAESGMTMDEFVDVIVEASGEAVTPMFENMKDTKVTNSYEFADGEGTFGEYTLELDGSTLKMTSDGLTVEFKK